jgi:hypothetical protein
MFLGHESPVGVTSEFWQEFGPCDEAGPPWRQRECPGKMPDILMPRDRESQPSGSVRPPMRIERTYRLCRRLATAASARTSSTSCRSAGTTCLIPLGPTSLKNQYRSDASRSKEKSLNFAPNDPNRSSDEDSFAENETAIAQAHGSGSSVTRAARQRSFGNRV